MPYKKGTAVDLAGLLNQITEWVTDTGIHGEDAWELIRNEPWPRGTIYKAKGVNGANSCYIGIMLLTHVKGLSYKNWLLQTPNLLKYLVRSPQRFNIQKPILHTTGSASFTILKDPNDTSETKMYSLSNIDIVNSDCTALSFGVFKQYQEGLDWNEQPGCIEFPSSLGFYPMKAMYPDAIKPSDMAPPIYPGVGYPGFGLPGGEPASGSFKYWLLKDACHLTVVINNDNQWDMAHAGMLNTYHSRMQYSFPAVIAGSNTGLRTIGSIDSNGDGGVIITKGARIDYSYGNQQCSRGMPCMPAFNSENQNVSQLVVCMPEGTWKFFNNWTQSLDTIATPHETYVSYRLVVGQPKRKEKSGYCLRPTDTDIDLVTSQTNVTTKTETNGDSTVITTTTTERVSLENFDLYDFNSTSEQNMLGNLWHMYWPSINHDYGEIQIANKNFLLLPNCWEGRMWYQPTTEAIAAISADESLTVEERLIKLKNLYDGIVAYGKQFRILIRLED